MENKESRADSRSAADTADLQDQSSQLSALIAERDALAAEKAELTDRLLRRQAEFDNFRRRVEREKLEMLEFSGLETVKSLLPVLDDFERAVQVESTDKEYSRGMELIYQRMLDTLTKLGLEPIDTKGKKFDPHVHHAIEMVSNTDAEDQTVLGEFQRGYNFRGRLLRPAMVKVAVQ
jgi:molecular chaperone GrpE